MIDIWLKEVTIVVFKEIPMQEFVLQSEVFQENNCLNRTFFFNLENIGKYVKDQTHFLNH